MNSMKKIGMVAIAATFLVGTAQAYTPPASFIMGKVLKDHEKIKTIDLDGVFSAPNAAEKIREQLRVDFANSKVIAVYSSSPENSDESTDDENAEAPAPSIPLGAIVTRLQDLHPLGRAWIGIGMDPYGNRVQATVEDLGVAPRETATAEEKPAASGAKSDVFPKTPLPDTSEVKLGRIGTTPVWQWGNGPNLLKILKDGFVFAGYQTPDEDLEVLDFTNKPGSVRFPKKVSATQHASSSEFIYELKSFKVNATHRSTPALTPIQSPVVQAWVNLVR